MSTLAFPVRASSPESLASCMEELLRSVQYKQIQIANATDGINNFAIDSPAVGDGRYWVILAASGVRLAGGAAGGALCGIYLMPPSAAGAAAPAAGANPANFEGIQIDSPNPVSGGSVTGGANSVLSARKIVVPPKWFVRFGSSGAAPPAGGQYALRLCYAELSLSFDALDLL